MHIKNLAQSQGANLSSWGSAAKKVEQDFSKIFKSVKDTKSSEIKNSGLLQNIKSDWSSVRQSFKSRDTASTQNSLSSLTNDVSSLIKLL